MKIVETEINGMKFSLETGRVARQAGGAVIVRYGECVVMVTACRGDSKNANFLPMTIDYVEKSYAAGKIPGGFFKREGRQGAKEVLTSRLIDRPCRPLFPKGFDHELQVVATVLSADPQYDTDVLALCGASAALTISDAPFEGPVAGVRVARVDGKLVINPSEDDRDVADLDMIVAGTKDAIVMVEGGAQEVPEAEIAEALFFAHREMQPIIQLQEDLKASHGQPEVEWVAKQYDEELGAKIREVAEPLIKNAIQEVEKLPRYAALKAAKTQVKEQFITEDCENPDEVAELISEVFEKAHYEIVRGSVFETGMRIDKRDSKTVRPINIEVGELPRAHGSALFTRGETQAIVVATLGTGVDEQRIDGLLGEYKKTFMLHYNFPPFSVGETRPMRGPGRREIGHGALAERAVSAILPDRKAFPYTIRIVSEITESNGSSSMATVCGSSLALMDAGVPLKAPVAGVAMGLMKEDDKVAILTDILGDEDHLGDMDFKVCGTKDGITALQMDIKIKGLEERLVTEALAQAKDARLHILEKMDDTIKSARDKVSKYAPKITTLKVNPDKIKDIIGPGGKMIRSLQESYEVNIDIEDNGVVTVAGTNGEKLEAAVKVVESLTAEPEVGKLYNGLVKRIADFGAFVEILPGTDGLCHISQLDEGRVERVTDVLQEGDEVWVKVLEVDRQGKIRLSRVEAMREMSAQ